MQISKKILNIIFIIVFMIIIAIPIFFSDFEGGKISTEENAEFGSIYFHVTDDFDNPEKYLPQKAVYMVS